MSPKGRHWMGLWLLGFLVVAVSVVRRQSAARELALSLRELETRRAALEVTRAGVLGEIQTAQSRGVLVPLVRGLYGLRLPEDSEIVILQEPRLR